MPHPPTSERELNQNPNSYYDAILTHSPASINLDPTIPTLYVQASNTGTVLGIPDGVFDGQILTISNPVDPGAGETVVVTPTTPVGFTTVTIAPFKFVSLQWRLTDLGTTQPRGWQLRLTNGVVA